MPTWNIMVEARGPARSRPLNPGDGSLGAFLDELRTWHGSAGGGDRAWDARITVKAKDTAEAHAIGTQVVSSAAKRAGLPAWPLVRVEVVREDLFRHDLAQPSLPEILGPGEVATLLGVSSQRLLALRRAGRFPEPALEVAAAPLWLRSTVESFVAQWDRRPGNPTFRAPRRSAVS